MIAFEEDRLVLQCQNRLREQRHRMCIAWHCSECVKYILRHLRPGFPFVFNFHGLVEGRHIANQEQIVEPADQRHFCPAQAW